ncbi:hypothetical protein HOLleu_23896 [Holothuria leucospilota]|uniref:Uncharacterized protein n=1 Tax=Holothuria leucospilota TaxID=206669 RepID=A0A9Q1H533_HOLLE|nr:hypothetical protein HOLleu_23896 [Holothuria leucospilota]
MTIFHKIAGLYHVRSRTVSLTYVCINSNTNWKKYAVPISVQLFKLLKCLSVLSM